MSRGEIVQQSTYVVPREVAAERLREGTITVPSALERQGLAKLAEMERKGQIAYAYNPRIEEDEKTGQRVWRCDYALLRTPRSRTPWYVAGTAAGLSAAVGLAYLLWQARWVLLVAALGTLALAFLLTRLAGHTGACVGIHCASCRG